MTDRCYRALYIALAIIGAVVMAAVFTNDAEQTTLAAVGGAMFGTGVGGILVEWWFSR